jgi:UDP-N-acetylglucosamine 2-epimerase (non-hydrolysing)
MINRTLMVVLGTRPEIIKLSPLLSRLYEVCERVTVVHSGQHYSYEMDALFFEELRLDSPQYRLNVGAAGLGPGEQTARMLAGLEPIIKREQPALTLVQGDTNTTLAGTLASVKLGVPVMHLEAGCRSFNRAMPEEMNRVMVDHVARWLLAPDETARQNLVAEGCQHQAEIKVVGSTGLEACRRAAPLASRRPLLEELKLTPGGYLVMTLHRAENTTPEILPGLVKVINGLAADCPVVFPVHPRTGAMLDKLGLTLSSGVIRLKPLGYLDMLGLMGGAKAVLTDSGGLQEEAAVLGRPVLVLRQETEWSYLVESGKAILAGNAFPATLDTCRYYLEPGNLAALEEARIPVPPDISGSILKIIADFFNRNTDLVTNGRGDLVKV